MDRSAEETIASEFRSPRQKLRRAKHHRDELQKAIEAYAPTVRSERVISLLTPADGGLYRRWLLVYPHRCEELNEAPADPPHLKAYVHKFRILTQPPEDLASIAADAIQNLRQSLDHAACACSRALGKSDKGTWFPLIAAGDDLESAIQDKARKLPPSIKDIIRESEPCGGLLYELHSLGLTDKHRLICEVGSLGMAEVLRLQASAKGWIAAGFGADEWDPQRSEIRFALTGAPDELDYDFRFGLAICFAGTASVATTPALTVLDRFANAVEDIIVQMERETMRLLS